MSVKNFVGLKNYIRVFTDDPLFYQSLFNTVRIMLFSIPLQIITGLLVATLLDSLRRGRRWFQTLNFLPYITTPVAIGFIFAYLFDWNIGPVNQLLSSLGVIQENINWLGKAQLAPVVLVMTVVWRSFGYFMVLYLSGLSAIPDDLYEAARVDGANAVQRFFKITLPSLRPITVFVVINSVINGFQMFDEPIRLFAGAGNEKGAVGGPGRSVLTIMWYFYDTAFKNNSRYGYGAAIAFSLCLIIAVISIINVTVLNRKEE